jgi:hypothetical protein
MATALPVRALLILQSLAVTIVSKGVASATQRVRRDTCASRDAVSYDVWMTERLTLYRPVGKGELELIRESGFRKFPPRLPYQPIFYPVLSEEYAREIAEKWNMRDPQSGYVGYVTRFAVQATFASQFPVQQVGDARHRELWIPAERVEDLNQNIIGKIEVIAEFPSPAPKV